MTSLLQQFQQLQETLGFRISRLEPGDYLDILLVALVLYLLFALIRRSQAAFLLRGVLVLLLILSITTLLIPLPTFTALLIALSFGILIAVPITLQPELRQWLEQIGRTSFLAATTRQEMAERVWPQLLRAIENLAAGKTGALIAIEGTVPLDDIAGTGIAVGGRLSAELLQTIFYDKTALHDGAVILRDDEVIAAGSILPLTNKRLTAYNRRFGTRHRAALGLSEASDALVIVVSEETGSISTASSGTFTTGLDSTQLRQEIVSFYDRTLQSERPRWRWRMPQFNWRSTALSFSYIIASLFLAIALWLVVTEQINPTIRDVIDDVPLTAVGLQPGRLVSNDIPDTVSVQYLTSEAEAPNLTASGFLAEVSLAEIGIGFYRRDVTARPSTDELNVRVLGAVPAAVDVAISRILTSTVAAQVDVADADQVSAAYEIVGQPVVTPPAVQVVGPEEDVERIARVFGTLSVAGATGSVREMVMLQAIDVDGNPVAGVALTPAQVQANQTIAPRFDARDVSVRPVTTGTVPEGYWLSTLSAEPATVTLQGNLDDIGSFVDTLPVDISSATGNVSLPVPLDLPDGITAIDASGATIGTVTVVIQVRERRGDMILNRPIQIESGTAYSVTVEPAAVEILLAGPQPTLDRIKADPELVIVTIDVSGLEPGESRDVTPRIVSPTGVTAQLITRPIVVTRVE